MNPPRVVFDCTVFAQALINPFGPAGSCLGAAQSREIELFITDYVIGEIRELPTKLPPRLRVTSERVESLILDLAKYAVFTEKVPHVFEYARDPDDTHYVDLSVHVAAPYLLSRDRDLLDLMGTGNVATDFKARFPQVRVLDPLSFIRLLHQAPDAGE